VHYNWEARDFWQYEFAQQRARDQEDKTDPTRTRLYILLAHEYVRDIIGQVKTTLDFSTIMQENKIVLLKLPADLSEDAKHFIGTILLSELLQATLTRDPDKRGQFCIFIDEFQNFANSKSINDLITQARKFGIATTIAHQERFGQFSEDKKILGATAAAANKVFFQLAVNDARELAPEFAKAPTTTETRLEPELVISKEPFWDLLRRGHKNPRIQELVRKYFQPLLDAFHKLQEQIDDILLSRTGYQSEATMYRDAASISGLGERREGAYDALGRKLSYDRLEEFRKTEASLERAMAAHGLARDQTRQLQNFYGYLKHFRRIFQNRDRFITAVMEGRTEPVPSQEPFNQLFIDLFADLFYSSVESVLRLYLSLKYGNTRKPYSIPSILAAKYWPQQLEDAYIQNEREDITRHYSDVKEKLRGTNEAMPDEVYSRWIQESLHKKLIEYREGEVKKHLVLDCAVLKKKGPYSAFENHLPDLPQRILTEREIAIIKDICYKELLEDSKNPLQRIEEHVELFTLLQKPENHIKVPSGQYVEKLVHVRPVHDMTDEMAQELANLPRFTAYVKAIEEDRGKQTVTKHKMQTLELTKSYLEKAEDIESLPDLIALHIIFSEYYYKKRTQIEEEIKQRIEKWRKSRSDEPPPTHY
jgi:hypothetical protein